MLKLNIYRGQKYTYTYILLHTNTHTYTQNDIQPQNTYYLSFLDKVIPQISKLTSAAIT